MLGSDGTVRVWDTACGQAHHSLYWSFHLATQPSGTLGGGGPGGASKSAIEVVDGRIRVNEVWASRAESSRVEAGRGLVCMDRERSLKGDEVQDK